ncbi:hypothetical protein BsWGS_11502 [Bradybaena similaris]
MELRRKNTVSFCISSYVLFYLCSLAIPVHSSTGSRPVHLFKRSSSLEAEESFVPLNEYLRREARDAADVTETESERQDKSCEAQKAFFSTVRENLKNGTRLEETHTFLNESKYNLALAWAGENDAGILLVLTTSEQDVFQEPQSTLWRSKDHGRTWEDWNSHVDNKIFRKDDGLQRNPHNPSKVYLVSYEHFIYVTENGGQSWKRSDLTSEEKTSLSVDEQLEFHSEQQFDDYVAIISNERKLYVTYNNFQTNAVEIKSGVHTVKWGTAEAKREKCLYVTTGDFSNPFFQIGPQMMDLERYDSATSSWKTILKRVVLFNVEDKFIYASIFKSEHPKTQDDERLMLISSDGGDTWGEAQLPTLTGDRFFSVLDMSEGLIFMHVDNPGDTGHGVLYTSSSSGLVYSESLRNHLFPNYNNVHDFYKIESIRGVYLTSQMNDDKSIHTMITYNRGAEWKKVTAPVGVECQNEQKDGCYLQIHNAYSIHRGINAQLPHSQKAAFGLVLVHAHVASNLQTTPPDVFLSTDGGYNFRRVLKGPHAYEIADSGGLLVAVPLNTEYPNIVKFSTDEGHCWHTYKFTSDDIKFTGLLTEPGGKSMTFGIWGYQRNTKKWTVNVIDFNTIVTRECKEDDYEPWTPHTSLNTRPGFEGCVNGRKETFKRIKADSWCRNGYYKNMDVQTDNCKCTEDDFECDFGFHRVDSVKCVRQPDIKAEQIDICKAGHLEKLETIGYRRLPGNTCDPKNGFHPVSDVTELDIVCNNGDKHIIKEDMTKPVEHVGSGRVVLAIIGTIVLVLVALVAAFFMYKLVLLRRHKVVYRYSRLNHGDGELESAPNHENLFSESSDEEIEQKNQPVKQNGNAPVKAQTEIKSYHDDSDDDMLG